MKRNTLLAIRMSANGHCDSDIEEAHRRVEQIHASIEDADVDPAEAYNIYSKYIESLGLSLEEIAYADDAPSADEFDMAYQNLHRVLAPFGTNSATDENADYFIVDDDYGVRELLVEVIDESIDWKMARCAITSDFTASTPGWSVILRFRNSGDEQIGAASR